MIQSIARIFVIRSVKNGPSARVDFFSLQVPSSTINLVFQLRLNAACNWKHASYLNYTQKQHLSGSGGLDELRVQALLFPVSSGRNMKISCWLWTMTWIHDLVRCMHLLQLGNLAFRQNNSTSSVTNLSGLYWIQPLHFHPSCQYHFSFKTAPRYRWPWINQTQHTVYSEMDIFSWDNSNVFLKMNLWVVLLRCWWFPWRRRGESNISVNDRT